MDAGVVEAPQFGPLRLRVPLSEFVAEREDALLGTCLLFVAPRPADQGVEPEFLDRFEQRDRLGRVARTLGAIVAIDYGYTEIRVSSDPYSLESPAVCDGAPEIEPSEIESADTVQIAWEINHAPTNEG